MPNTRNVIFVVIMLGALILILLAVGGGPVFQQFVVTAGQAIGSFFQALIRK
jgi:hypothetical protein